MLTSVAHTMREMKTHCSISQLKYGMTMMLRVTTTYKTPWMTTQPTEQAILHVIIILLAGVHGHDQTWKDDTQSEAHPIQATPNMEPPVTTVDLTRNSNILSFVFYEISENKNKYNYLIVHCCYCSNICSCDSCCLC